MSRQETANDRIQVSDKPRYGRSFALRTHLTGVNSAIDIDIHRQIMAGISEIWS